MRREIKYPAIGFTAGFVTGGLIDFIVQAIRLDEKNEFQFSKIDWLHCLKTAFSVGSIGAIAGYGIYRWQLYSESQLPFDPDRFLSQLLSDNCIKNDVKFYESAIRERDQIKKYIAETFNDQLINGKAINWGSTAKGTAIGNCSDFDIILPFSKSSFCSLEEMYNSVYEAMYKQYSSVNCDVRKQRRSIGITLYIDSTTMHFDVVPGREINDYRTDGELNLYERSKDFWSRPTRIKTNIRTHKQQTANRPEERKIIKLIKLYRTANGLEISSSVIQHLVLDCFDDQVVTQSVSDNFLYCLEYIATVIPYYEIIDPANSNNTISQNLSSSQRSKIASRINCDLKKISENELYIKEIFQ